MEFCIRVQQPPFGLILVNIEAAIPIFYWCENIFSQAFMWKMSSKGVMVLLEKNFLMFNIEMHFFISSLVTY